MEIKLKKGFDIKLVGQAEKTHISEVHPDTYAFKPTDFATLTRPKVMVQEGDNVKAGTPIFFDKKNPKVKFTAPVSGEIVEIKRGAKRYPLEIKILADKEIVHQPFQKHTTSDIENLSKEAVIVQLCDSGVFGNIIQRPYGTVANPDDTPRAIFVSTFDTSPLAPDTSFLLKGEDVYFEAGINVLNKLTKKLHLNLNRDGEVVPVFSKCKNVQINKISGKHPAGNVGVQIHHIDPIKKGEIVWTISPFGVLQIGKLFMEGIYDTTKVISLVGPEVKKPQYIRTHTGACIDKIIADNLNSDVSDLRLISGNVLTGTKVQHNGYLGFNDNMITVLKEGNDYDFLGWILPTSRQSKSLSFQRAAGLFSFLTPNKAYNLTTNTNGEHRAYVQNAVYSKVLPMDIFPLHLIKAIMANDYDAMEQLGIYELIEEDIALCEFVDVSKTNMQQIIREGLTLLQNS